MSQPVAIYPEDENRSFLVGQNMASGKEHIEYQYDNVDKIVCANGSLILLTLCNDQQQRTCIKELRGKEYVLIKIFAAGEWSYCTPLKSYCTP